MASDFPKQYQTLDHRYAESLEDWHGTDILNHALGLAPDIEVVCTLSVLGMGVYSSLCASGVLRSFQGRFDSRITTAIRHAIDVARGTMTIEEVDEMDLSEFYYGHFIPQADLILRMLRFQLALMHEIRTLDIFYNLSSQVSALREGFHDKVKEQLETAELKMITDPGTGLLNKLAYLNRVNEIREEDPNSHYVVITLDLDHFKLVNDTYGHEVGDEVLAGFGRVIQAFTRAGDSFRFGGEEFRLIMKIDNDAAKEAAIRRAQQIMIGIGTQIFTSSEMQSNADADVGCSHPFIKTVSIGIADGKGSNIDSVIKKSDEQVYKAKKTGRNRICIDGLNESVDGPAVPNELIDFPELITREAIVLRTDALLNNNPS